MIGKTILSIDGTEYPFKWGKYATQVYLRTAKKLGLVNDNTKLDELALHPSANGLILYAGLNMGWFTQMKPPALDFEQVVELCDKMTESHWQQISEAIEQSNSFMSNGQPDKKKAEELASV